MGVGTIDHTMATEFAPVTPAVLRWARESVDVTVAEAAARAAVTEERIRAWEQGEAEPTLAKLRALGKLYQRPLAVFFLPEPPLRFDAMRDFRRLPGTVSRTWSRPLHKVYRRALEQQEIATEILQADGIAPLSRVPTARLTLGSEAAGALLRESLGISLVEQVRWRRPEDSFNGWLEAVEDAGVFVLRTSEVHPEEMSGFSITGAVPVIVVNALDWPRRQVFTLLHEYAHLMLREGGLCDLLEPETPEGSRVEQWTNATAAAALIPSNVLRADLSDVPESTVTDDETIAWVAGRYGVSREAVARRLVTLDMASFDFYLAKREEYLRAYEERREEERAKRRARKASGGPPPYRMAVRDRGKPYVRLVLDAYQRDVLSASSLSNVLSLKLKHLPNLTREVR